jgi:hypothetical protein
LEGARHVRAVGDKNDRFGGLVGRPALDLNADTVISHGDIANAQVIYALLTAIARKRTTREGQNPEPLSC